MSDRGESSDKSQNSSDVSQRRSSRGRYRGFVEDYKRGRLADPADGEPGKPPDDSSKTDEDGSPPRPAREKRRQYLREYFRWLWPHRYAVAVFFVFALLAAGLQMIEPLFMRFIIDKVLLNTGLDTATRLTRLHFAGGVFLGVIIL